MIFTDLGRALGQLGDPRLLRVLVLGVLLAAGLVALVATGLLGVIPLLVPDSVTLPWIGPVGGVDAAAGWVVGLVLLLVSVFLMVPIAAVCTGLFLERVVDAVEDRHYPGLPPVVPVPLWEALVESVTFAGLVIAVNLIGLLAFALTGPLAPLMFWAVNGFLLGREYFTLVAQRRLGRAGAQALRARHAGRVWAAGALMAVPLSLPLVNLLIPVVGVAMFTHLVHRLTPVRV